MTKRSFGVVGLLLLAAVLGMGVGAVLGNRPGDEDALEAMFAHADSTAEKLIPMGEPMSGAPRDGVDPMAADPRSLRGIPPYPGAQPRRLADVGQVMGMPLMASWFATKDQPEQIISHYEYTYADAGVPIVSQMFGRDMGYVAWLEEEKSDGGLAEGIVHMVSVIKNTPTSTETIVLLSASRPQRLLDGKRNLPAGLVLPTEARPPQVVQMAMEGKTRSVVTTARRGELRDTVDEIMTLMRRDGWAVEDLMSSQTSRSFIGRKAGRSQSVSASFREGAGEVKLMYTLEQARTAP